MLNCSNQSVLLLKMRKKLKRISPAGYVGCYYLLTEWRDSDEAGFDLLVSDGRQAWQCQGEIDS